MAYASHPLITDDTGTQGKGKFQFELNGQISFDREARYDDNAAANVTIKRREAELKAALTYGVIDSVDVILSAPHQWKRVETDGPAVFDMNGIADMSIEVKWRFFEKNGLSFALKPGLTLPTGDQDKDLGTGKATFTSYLIATKEITPWAFHLNLGYKRNENRLDQRLDIWHASMAGEVKVMKNLKLVANIGMERNPEENSETHPAFILGGFIYSIWENFDIDLGIKGALNSAEKDYTILSGITVRF